MEEDINIKKAKWRIVSKTKILKKCIQQKLDVPFFLAIEKIANFKQQFKQS
jgi:hypothetical protein